VTQRLGASRHLFDWSMTGEVVPANPAASVRGTRHVVMPRGEGGTDLRARLRKRDHDGDRRQESEPLAPSDR